MSVSGSFGMRMQRISLIDVAEFIQHLKSDTNLVEDDPINVLRRDTSRWNRWALSDKPSLRGCPKQRWGG